MASKVHHREVTIRVFKAKHETPGCDHTQFLIEEVVDTGDKQYAVEDPAATGHIAFLSGSKISPATFVTLFPFHVIFDRQFLVRGVGSSLLRVIPQLMPSSGVKRHCRLNDIFDMLRPHMTFDFKTIVSHIMTVFVLKTVDGLMVESKTTGQPEPLSFKLKVILPFQFFRQVW